jgi:hypothetical protein
VTVRQQEVTNRLTWDDMATHCQRLADIVGGRRAARQRGERQRGEGRC